MQTTKSLSKTSAPVLISRFARLEIGGLARKLARAFGYNKPATIPLEDIKIPDTALAKQATELVESCSPDFLFNHSIRSYFFGACIAKHLKLKADMEVMYLAAIMHDLGLVAPHNKTEGSFEVVGADVAQAFLLENNYARDKAELVHEAIALHSAVGIADKLDAEIALVHYGAGVDVIGFRMEDIAVETREAIVAAHPRHDFKQAFPPLLKDQVEAKPFCHIAGHYQLGFVGKIKGAAFPE